MKYAVMILTLLALTSMANGYDASPRCFRELETSFFDETALNQTLDIHKVFPSSWGLIYRDLKAKSRQVPRLVESEAKKQKKNPLERPFSPKEAEKILLRVLYGVFRETLISYDITSESDIREMFNYIKMQQSQRLASCLSPKKSANQNAKPN